MCASHFNDRMEALHAQNVSALANLLKQEDDGVDSGQQQQLVTPASLGINQTPHTTVKPAKPKKVADPGEIWAEEEVPEKIDVVREKDKRKRPWYDILYKQSVSAMDAFGSGLTGNTPSSISCNQIVVKIKFPGHKMKDLVRVLSQAS